MDFDLVGKDNVTGAVEKATESLDGLQEKAEETGKKVGKGGKKAQKDWGGVADLFSGLLPRGLTKQYGNLNRLSDRFNG